jgi:CBS domain-containing protein
MIIFGMKQKLSEETYMNILFFLTPKENVAHIDDNDTLRQALETMEHRGYAAIPILTQDGKYIGTVTEGDMLWYLKSHGFPSLRKMEKLSIMDVARRRDNEAVNISISMEGLVDKITNQNFVPVVDDNNVFIGIITRKDVILYLSNKELVEG